MKLFENKSHNLIWCPSTKTCIEQEIQDDKVPRTFSLDFEKKEILWNKILNSRNFTDKIHIKTTENNSN